MGFAKRRLEELQDRGFGEVPGTFVCADCIGNKGLKKIVQSNAVEKKCSYCGKHSDDPIAASLEDVISAIAEAVALYFEKAVEILPYCSQEGGYIGSTYDIRDAVEMLELEITSPNEERLYEDLFLSFDDEPLTDREYGITAESQKAITGWRFFCEQVKHRSRYLFADIPYVDTEFVWERYPMPNKMLPLILQYINRQGLIRIMPKDTCFFRVRVVSKADCSKIINAKGLASPPQECALFSNRMSPAGVSMFYGSEDLATAEKEVLLAGKDKSRSNKILVWGKFRSLKDISVVDLYRGQSVCLFDQNESPEDLNTKIFLNHFSSEISRPINKKDAAWVEYVPSQIVTEYLRYKCSSKTGLISGIIFRSSIHRKMNCALFLENECFVDQGVSDERSFFELVESGKKDL